MNPTRLPVHVPARPRLQFRPWGALSALGAVPLASILVLSLAGCAPEPGDDASGDGLGTQSAQAVESAQPTESEQPEELPQPARAAVEDCGWGQPQIAADTGAIPASQEGALSDVLPGAWQHVGIDEGAGYDTELHADIRFVFPSTSEIIYCQDVPGITDQAENRAAFDLAGTEIVLPAPATGYSVQSWSENAMVWLNHRDGSLYLLQRR